MTIGLAPNVIYIPAGPPTDNDAGQHQRSAPDQAKVLAGPPATVERVDPVTLQKRVEALQHAESGSIRRQREQEELPRESQQALQLYRTNQLRSEGQPSGGELVGIDLYV